MSEGINLDLWREAKGEDHWLDLVDPEGEYTAGVKWDGCIHFTRHFNGPLNEMQDNLHICDVDDLIARLQALKAAAQAHFGKDWTGEDASTPYTNAFNAAVIDEGALRATLVAALKATLPALIRLGDFIGDEDVPGVVGIGPFDRCAIIGQVREALDKARLTKNP